MSNSGEGNGGAAPAENQPQQEEVKIITLKIQLPSSISPQNQTVDVNSSLSENLGDIKQSLTIIPACQHLTSYDIVFKGIKLTEIFDDAADLESILSQLELPMETLDILNLSLKEKPYNLSGVYEHILKFREVIGLHFLDRTASDLGVAGGLSKFNDVELTEVKQNENSKESTPEEGGNDEKEPEVELSDEEKANIIRVSDQFISGETTSISNHGNFSSVINDLKIPIKSLSISQWSPVPPAQKTKGDLLYLTLQTLEGEIIHITCHLSGFFVNRSSTARFNPIIKINEKGSFHKDFILYNLVSSISPLFAKTIAENELMLGQSTKYPETYLLPTNTQLSYPWLANPEISVVQPDSSRAQLPAISFGVDGSDFVKDWNDDFQAIKELPKDTINQRILRERLINKSLFEFKKVATETAIEIIKGNLSSLNPNEQYDRQIYLKNGVFYSFSVDATGAFENTGDDEAARYAASKDLAGVRILNHIDADGIHNLVTCIVDYLGERIICQAPVPGIFNSPEPVDEEGAEPADKVAYGLTTDHSSVLANEKFNNALKPIAQALHVKPHSVELESGVKSNGELNTSKDIKGIIGTDDRKYVIDLYRTTPLDIEFIESHYDESKETSYPHREAVIRHEAVEEWYKRKVAAFLKVETERLEKEGKPLETTEGEKPQINIPYDQIVLNPDVFTGVNENKEEQEDVRYLSNFIKDKLVEEFLDQIGKSVVPFDGNNLTDVLHRQGINMRYLGILAEQCLVKKDARLAEIEESSKTNLEKVEAKKADDAKKAEEEKAKSPETRQKEAEEKAKNEAEEAKDENKEKEQTNLNIDSSVSHYNALYKVLVQEMVARAVKHLLRKLGKLVPVYLKNEFVSHFHNCLFGAGINENPDVQIDDVLKSFYNEEDFEFSKLNTASVLELIKSEVFVRYRYDLPNNWNSDLIRPLQLFREIALKFGIQWKAQDYGFTKESFDAIKDKLSIQSQVVETTKTKKNKKKHSKDQQQVVEVVTPRTTIFVADDIVNFVPIVKDSTYKALLLDEIFETARLQIYKGDTEIGVNLLTELASIYEQVYGGVHQQTTKFNSLLAQSYADLGFKTEACNVARKACILSERTNGFDSYETITNYINAAFLEAANGDFVNAFHLYKKAFDDWSFVFGEGHPSSVNTLSNLAEILGEHKLFKQSEKFYLAAIEASDKLNDDSSSISTMLRYKYAFVLLQEGKYEESLKVFKKVAEGLDKLVGPEDRLNKDVSALVGNIGTYLAYNEHQAAEKRKVLAQQAAAHKGKFKVKSVTEAPSAPVKNGKKAKKQSAQPNPEIATQSVDDILNFIEGSSKGKKNGKNSKKSKK